MPTPSRRPVEKRAVPLAELLQGKLSEHVGKPAQRMVADLKKSLGSLYTRSYQKSDKVLTPVDLDKLGKVLTPAQQVGRKFSRLVTSGK